MVPQEGKVKPNRGSPRKRAKGAGEKGLEAGLRGAGGKQTGQASPKKSLRSSSGFSDKRGFGLLRGGGAQWSSLHSHYQNASWKSRPESHFPPPRESVPLPASASTQKKTKMGSCLPARMPRAPHSVLTLRKAKCAPSRPHA